MTDNNHPVLRTTQLGKRFGQHWAVVNAELTIMPGDILGLVGRNGAGKTTLMKMITGLCRPSSGKIELFGQEQRLEDQRHRLGTIVETPAFFPQLNGLQNLEYFRLQRGITDPGAIERVLRQVKLWDERRKKFKAYSLGMKQRLGLALALMGQPDFLILDEPINGVDPEGIAELRENLLQLARERKIAILISSHILAELQNLANRYAFIDEGRILKQITARELAEATAEQLIIEVDEAPRALAFLQEKMQLEDCRIDQNERLCLPRNYPAVPELISLLATNGFRLHAVERRGVSLEDYFLKLIQA